MPTRTTPARLWPYSALAAVLAIPLTWLVLAVLAFLARTYLGLQLDASDRLPLFVALILGALPVALVLLDFAAAKGAVVGSKWLTVDFSKSVVESGNVRREVSGLPENILSQAESIQDSGGVKMVAAIRRSTTTEIVSIDLKDGNAWWETRLLVLCAGAIGASSSLRAIVFIGRRSNRDRTFLGWGTPAQLLAALLDSNPEYRARLAKARMIVRQLSAFGGGMSPLLPFAGATVVSLHPEVASQQYSYDENESVMLARILLQLLQSPGAPVDPRTAVNLEEPPPRLTIGRLHELFESCLGTDTVDRGLPDGQQLSQFLASTGAYVAIVRQGVYEGMLRADLGERAILRDLMAASRNGG